MQQFYIYDDNSSQPLMDVLWPYIDAGVVEYSYFKGWQHRANPTNPADFAHSRQFWAYDDCAKRCADAHAHAFSCGLSVPKALVADVTCRSLMNARVPALFCALSGTSRATRGWAS